MNDEMPPMSPYRIKQAQEIYQEVQRMNVEVDVTNAIVGYLQSGEFITLWIIFFLYRLGRALVAIFAPYWKRR